MNGLNTGESVHVGDRPGQCSLERDGAGLSSLSNLRKMTLVDRLTSRVLSFSYKPTSFGELIETS